MQGKMGAELNRFSDMVTQRRMGWDQNLMQQLLQFMERREDPYPAFGAQGVGGAGGMGGQPQMSPQLLALLQQLIPGFRQQGRRGGGPSGRPQGQGQYRPPGSMWT